MAMADPTAYQIACRMLAQDACEPDHIDAAINEAYQDGWDDAMKKLAAVEREALEPIRELAVSDAFKALQRYEQADEDGVRVLVSRQAIDEIIAALRGLKRDT